MQAQIEQRLRTFIVENFFFGQTTPLGVNDSFLEKGIIDSTGILELVTYVEETYGIQVASEELAPENFDSISRLSKFVRHKLTISKPVSTFCAAGAQE